METKNIDRREFLRRAGIASAVVGAAATLNSCAGGAGTDKVAEALTGEHVGTGEKEIGEMTYRTNPNTGDRVSLLGYGMMRLPQVQKGQERADGNDLDQEQINRLVDYALEHGVNYYDTSPAYCKGFSEEATGTALARHPRNTYFIATKLSNFAPQQQTREESQKMFHNSLRYLKTDYIDYLLLHAIGGGGMDNFNRRYMDNGILDWLVEQKKAGKIRNLGFSYHGDLVVFDEMMKWHDEGRYHWDFVQIQMNYVDWNNEVIAHEYYELEKRNIPAVIMEPLLGGRLVKLPTHVVNHLKARRPSDSPASWAFRFLGTYPNVMCSLSGMTYMEHLQDNLRTHCPLEPLSEEEMTYLHETAKLIQKYPTVPCNDCKYCMPCPYGLDIPAILLHYNKMVNEGSVPKDQQDPQYQEMRRKYLISYDRAVPAVRQADRCVGCRVCVSHCPQRINIPQTLERIASSIEEMKRNV
ncbi:MAG: aldo/keto reductase [Bacteroidales bacterium]|nr:aldo/keto reductase [Candidatus Liminaster caballi]